MHLQANLAATDRASMRLCLVGGTRSDYGCWDDDMGD